MSRPRILVVDDDRSLLQLVRTGLELEGCAVVEAMSLAAAESALDDTIDGIVLDRELPDGDGLALFARIHTSSPTARVVVHTSREVPQGLSSASKGDVDAILDQLQLRDLGGTDSATRAALAAASRLRAIWFDLCRRSAAVGGAFEPPLADTIIAALTDAFIRPQLLGRLEQAIDPLMQAFAADVESPEAALAMVGCLGEAWSRAGIEGSTVRELEGVSYRTTVILDRMMLAVAKSAVQRLTEQALTDPLTGLGNRRAFDQAIDRETARAMRHQRALSVAMIDLDGLKVVNDTRGHAAGDAALVALADAVADAIRTEDAVYRIGGDEFAIILADAGCLSDEDLERRIRAGGGPPFTLGLATAPQDDVDRLVEVADRRLYERRSQR